MLINEYSKCIRQGYVSIWASNQKSLKYTAFRSLEIWKHLAEKFSSIKKSAGDPTIQQSELFASARADCTHVSECDNSAPFGASSRAATRKTQELHHCPRALSCSIFYWDGATFHFYIWCLLRDDPPAKVFMWISKANKCISHILFYVYHSAQTCSVWPSELRPCYLHKGKLFLKMKKSEIQNVLKI